MRDTWVPILFVAFVIVFIVTGGFFSTTKQVEVGSLTVSFQDEVNVDQPLTATTTITDGNFDSFDLPLGTSFVVDSSSQFVIGGFSLTSSTTEIRVDFGYGDTHVENSVSAPTNAVTLGSFVIIPASGLERVPVLVKVPAGKNPFVRVVGDASNGHITAIGVNE